MRLDAYLLTQQIVGQLLSEDTLWTAVQVHLAVILTVGEALHNLGTFDFVVEQLFSSGIIHSSVVLELLHPIERLE